MVTGINCLQQCGHYNFEIVAPGKTAGLFMVATAKGDTRLWSCPGSHKSFYYTAAVKKTMKSILCMDEVIIPPLSVFVDDGNLQHSALRWNRPHTLSYHVQVQRRIAFVYRDSPTAGVSPERTRK